MDTNPIIVGCNYHTTWQSKPGMRFVLRELNGPKALLITRQSRKKFWTDTKDLIFIKTKHNFEKAKRLTKSIKS